MVVVSDPSGEAWFLVFNDQAEQIVGCTVDELDRIKPDVIDLSNNVYDELVAKQCLQQCIGYS